jgi:uncharacterized protein YndB with AHSA1/START domain
MNEVVIKRVFNISLNVLWTIWTERQHITVWFGSDPNGTVLSTDVDLSVGGKYKISFQDSNGAVHTAFGEYLEIVEFVKLRYTWEWASEPGFVTEVTVEFRPQGEKTLLKFTHANLNPSSSHGYLEGWNGTFDKIVAKIIDRKL